MKNIILKTDLCRVEQSSGDIKVLIKMKSGEWVETMPMSNDLRGIIQALTLSIDVLSGKVWLNGLTKPTAPKMETKLAIGD